MNLRPWTVTRSERVLQDPHLTVRADRCKTAEGATVDPYYVLEYPDWVHVVALDARGWILMIRQYRHAAGVVSLELPAGSMDPADESPLAAARRELAEETGYAAESYESLGSYSPNPATHANRSHGFIARGISKFGEPKIDPVEIIEHEFIDPARVLELIDRGEIIHLIQIPTIYQALMRVGYLSASPQPIPQSVQPRPVRLHHVQISVPVGAEQAGREFYCSVLGFPEIPKPEALLNRGGFWLQAGERQVHVGTEDGFDRKATKTHLAYEVADLDFWKLRLAEHGIKTLDSIPIRGFDRLEFRDPFGNRVELIQPLR